GRSSPQFRPVSPRGSRPLERETKPGRWLDAPRVRTAQRLHWPARQRQRRSHDRGSGVSPNSDLGPSPQASSPDRMSGPCPLLGSTPIDRSSDAVGLRSPHRQPIDRRPPVVVNQGDRLHVQRSGKTGRTTFITLLIAASKLQDEAAELNQGIAVGCKKAAFI